MSKPTRRKRGGQPGNGNALKHGRTTADARSKLREAAARRHEALLIDAWYRVFEQAHKMELAGLGIPRGLDPRSLQRNPRGVPPGS